MLRRRAQLSVLSSVSVGSTIAEMRRGPCVLRTRSSSIGQAISVVTIFVADSSSRGTQDYLCGADRSGRRGFFTSTLETTTVPNCHSGLLETWVSAVWRTSRKWSPKICAIAARGPHTCERTLLQGVGTQRVEPWQTLLGRRGAPVPQDGGGTSGSSWSATAMLLSTEPQHLRGLAIADVSADHGAMGRRGGWGRTSTHEQGPIRGWWSGERECTRPRAGGLLRQGWTEA
jgi:hypothetical protein